MKLVHLEEIAHATKIVQNYPNAIQKLDNCLNLLYNVDKCEDIINVIAQINESKWMMQITLEVYTEVLKNAKEN
jgi:hypothetical protein